MITFLVAHPNNSPPPNCLVDPSSCDLLNFTLNLVAYAAQSCLVNQM